MFLADTPVWIDGALVQISEVVPGQTFGRFGCTVALLCLKQIEKVQEHQGTFECRDITLENGNRSAWWTHTASCLIPDDGSQHRIYVVGSD